MKIKILTLATALVALSVAAHADDVPTYTIKIKNGAFVPAATSVPTGQKLHLIVKNEDDVKAEFESTQLNREEKVAPHEQIDVYVDPLDAGNYKFFDDNNPDATGSLVAK